MANQTTSTYWQDVQQRQNKSAYSTNKTKAKQPAKIQKSPYNGESDYWQDQLQRANQAAYSNYVKANTNQKVAKTVNGTKLPHPAMTTPKSPLAKNPLPIKASANGTGGTGGYGGYGNGYRTYSSGGSGSGGTAVGADSTNELAALAAALEAQKQARLDAINAANAALDQQATAMKGRYDTSLQDIAAQYQQLRNAAEVNRYRAQYNQREALANRGALDSGAGRQEALALQNNYNNNLNSISTAEAADRAAIQNAINEMYASVEQQKASNMTNGLADYSSALQNLINATYSGYTPEGSTYYQLAANQLGGNNLYQKYLQSLGYNV